MRRHQNLSCIHKVLPKVLRGQVPKACICQWTHFLLLHPSPLTPSNFTLYPNNELHLLYNSCSVFPVLLSLYLYWCPSRERSVVSKMTLAKQTRYTFQIPLLSCLPYFFDIISPLSLSPLHPPHTPVSLYYASKWSKTCLPFTVIDTLSKSWWSGSFHVSKFHLETCSNPYLSVGEASFISHLHI